MMADSPDTERGFGFDPLIPRVVQQAASRAPILLPWQPRVLPLGTFFRSAATASSSNPFAPQSAFDADSLSSIPITFSTSDASGRFRSSEGLSSSSSTDHLSVGVGVGVDLVFLEASVSVHYDRDVLENHDGNKASVTTSYRAGSVAFTRPPELSAEAFGVFIGDEAHGRPGGIDDFHAKYGDYYVSGYRIGGDASVLFTTQTSTRHLTEIERVDITVESCFGDEHERRATSSVSTEHGAEVRMSAYSTIDQTLIRETARAGSPRFEALLQQGRAIHRRAQTLEDRVAQRLQEVGVQNGGRVTPQQCMQLCERALVVELLLMPVESLRQVRQWSITKTAPGVSRQDRFDLD